MLLDSFGTLVSMEPPGPHLRDALARAGHRVGAERAAEAFRAEIAYYLEHHVEGRDPESLAELRDRCADVLRIALDEPGLSHATARAALLGSVRFAAFPDAAPALRELRRRGLRLVVASNWDASLPEVLAQAGLKDLVDGVLPSAAVGAAKPARALFDAALELAGTSAEHAIYVGDSPANDVAGAAAAGIRAVLLRRGAERLDRSAADAAVDGVRPLAEIERLDELPRVL